MNFFEQVFARRHGMPASTEALMVVESRLFLRQRTLMFWIRPLVIAVLVASVAGLVGCVGGFQPTGWSGIVEAEDGLIIGTADGRVVAVGWEGQRQWEFPRGDEEKLGALYGRPVVTEEAVYLGGFAGKLYAIERENGTLKWFTDLEAPIVGGPSIFEEMVLVASDDGKLYAFDAERGGGPQWTFPSQAGLGKIWSSPTIHNGVAYFGSLDHRMYAVDMLGEPAWDRPFEADGAIVGTPLILHHGNSESLHRGDRLYFGSFDNSLYALDAQNGELVGKMEADGWFWSGPTGDGDVIYAGNLDGNVYAWNGISASPEWRFTTDGPILVPPIKVSGERIVVVSEEGTVYVLRTAPELRDDQRVDWQFHVGAKVRAPLAARDTVVYLSALDGTVRALDTSRRQQLWQMEIRG